VFHIGNLLFLGFNIGCALAPSTASFIVFRFLGASYVNLPDSELLLTIRKAGLAGSTPIACGGGVIADLFAERDRASAMALFSLGPLMGAFHGVQL